MNKSQALYPDAKGDLSGKSTPAPTARALSPAPLAPEYEAVLRPGGSFFKMGRPSTEDARNSRGYGGMLPHEKFRIQSLLDFGWRF